MKKNLLLFMALIMIFSCLKDKDKKDSKIKNFPVPDKLCALTFDDGPDTIKTALVLDKLSENGIVATFFMIGRRIGSTPSPSTKSLVQRLLSTGNEIGNHSWDFASMNNMTTEQIQTSINNTNTAIQSCAASGTKIQVNFFRPPNLAISDIMYDAINMVFAEGIVGYDWDSENTTPQQCANYILNGGLRDGAIILLHDVQSNSNQPTLKALDILIPELKKQGYEFVTLSQLFSRKGVSLNATENKMWKYVE